MFSFQMEILTNFSPVDTDVFIDLDGNREALSFSKDFIAGSVAGN